jgi:hypothetical protein
MTSATPANETPRAKHSKKPLKQPAESKQTSSPGNHENRRVFMQARGIADDATGEIIQPFIRYEAGQVVQVKRDPVASDSEDYFRKGSSSSAAAGNKNKKKNTPAYRGGYK